MCICMYMYMYMYIFVYNVHLIYYISTFDQELQKQALDSLRSEGVDIRLNTKVISIQNNTVTFKSNNRLVIFIIVHNYFLTVKASIIYNIVFNLI